MSINRIKGPKKPQIASSKDKKLGSKPPGNVPGTKESRATSGAEKSTFSEAIQSKANANKTPSIAATAEGRKSGSKEIASLVLEEYRSGKIKKSDVVPRLVDEVLSAGKIKLSAAHMKSFRAQMELHVQNDPFFKSLLAKIG